MSRAHTALSAHRHAQNTPAHIHCSYTHTCSRGIHGIVGTWTQRYEHSRAHRHLHLHLHTHTPTHTYTYKHITHITLPYLCIPTAKPKGSTLSSKVGWHSGKHAELSLFPSPSLRLKLSVLSNAHSNCGTQRPRIVVHDGSAGYVFAYVFKYNQTSKFHYPQQLFFVVLLANKL